MLLKYSNIMAKKFRNKKDKNLPKGQRKSKKRTNWMKTGASVASAAYSGYKMGKYLLQLINVEHKWYDVTNDITSGSWGAGQGYCIAPLCVTNQIGTNQPGIVPGDGPNDLIGQSIKLESLFLRGTMSISPNAYLPTPDANPFCTVRMIIVYDTDTSGSGASDPTQYGNVNSPMTMLEPNRYKILKDKLYTLNINNNYSHTFKSFKQLDTHLLYNYTQDTMMSGNYYIWFYCDQPAVATVNHGPIINLTTRIRFIDN